MANRARAGTYQSGADLPARTRFFVWLGGGDVETLAATPRERHKFTGVGGVVLMTSTMAATSFAFALVIAAHLNIFLAILAGLAWGIGIMNLDRWLVTATPRRPLWWQNLLQVLPRLILALIVGTVISTPLVLWIFQREINTELVTIHEQKRAAFETQLKSDPELSRIPTDQTNVTYYQGLVDGTSKTLTDPTAAIKQLTADTKTAFDNWQHWLNLADCERDGTSGCPSGQATGVAGKGPNWHDDMNRANDFKAVYDRTEAELKAAQSDHSVAISKAKDSAQSNLTAVTTDLNQLLAKKAELTNANDAQLANDDGLLARLDALSRLTGTNGTLKAAYIMLALFITAIETMPVLTKFLMNIGTVTVYEEVITIKDDYLKEEARAEAQLSAQIRRQANAARAQRAADDATRVVQDQYADETRRLHDDDWDLRPGETREAGWHRSVPTEYTEAPPSSSKRRFWQRSDDTTNGDGSDDYGYWTSRN